jgi:hypothetical protein
VPIAPSAQHLTINSATVITDQNAKIAGRIVNLNLNLARARVAKCIHKGFAANAVHLVANNGMQRSWQAFHDDAKVNLLLNDKFLRNAGKRLSEVARIVIRGTQTTNGIAAFSDDPAHERKNPFHQRFLR